MTTEEKVSELRPVETYGIGIRIVHRKSENDKKIQNNFFSK